MDCSKSSPLQGRMYFYSRDKEKSRKNCKIQPQTSPQEPARGAQCAQSHLHLLWFAVTLVTIGIKASLQSFFPACGNPTELPWGERLNSNRMCLVIGDWQGFPNMCSYAVKVISWPLLAAHYLPAVRTTQVSCFHVYWSTWQIRKPWMLSITKSFHCCD